MFRTHSPRLFGTLALAGLLFAPSALAADGQDDFHRAYYLEKEQGDLEAALALYRQVAQGEGAPQDLRQRARLAARACAEEIAASDFARLMPADTLLYVELNNPGDQLSTLLAQLGLLQGSEGSGNIALSPRLVHALLGVRGAALGVTEFDPRDGSESGVIILHPGDIDLFRGVIETLLPAGGQPVENIEGFPTFIIQGEHFVTTTERLVIASDDLDQIRGVVRRLAGDSQDSLADNGALSETLALRGEDLLFFCVNAQPLMPMVTALLAQEFGNDPQVAMALGLLDLASTRGISGRLGVDEDGLSLDVGLQLADDHRNLVFNFMRKPFIGERTFQMIPEGVAAFVALPNNEPAEVAPGLTDGLGRPVVTSMDFGREIFANLVDVSLFCMPSVSMGPGRQPIPDVGLALTVNDLDRSLAIWDLLLGVAKAATGGGDVEPTLVEIAGVSVKRYDIEEVSLYLAAHGQRMVFALSEEPIAAAVHSAREGRSVLDDERYRGLLGHFGEGQVFALAANVGRLAEIGKVFAPPAEMQMVAPYLAMLDETVLSCSLQHTATTMVLSARLGGLPRLGGAVSELVAMQMGAGGDVWTQRQVTQPKAIGVKAVYASDAGSEVQAQEAAVSKPAAGHSEAELRQAFEKLAAAGQFEGARHLGGALFKQFHDDPLKLNNLAWALITESHYGHRFDDLALELAVRCNELSEFGNWYYLDTLGHALYFNGKLEEAIKIQKRALTLAADDERVDDVRKALVLFKQALSAAGGID
ncbi:MAG: hypothetical protein V3T22_01955 [Planctomycetota bacterium]